MTNNYVKIFDTTLRDGEQSPGATMTSAEKLEVAHNLARLGVDIIEAGFPAASPDDLEAVRRIAVEVGNPSKSAVLSGSKDLRGSEGVCNTPLQRRKHPLRSRNAADGRLWTGSTVTRQRELDVRAPRAPRGRTRRPRLVAGHGPIV